MADTQQFKKKKQKHDKNRKDVHFQAEDKIWNKVHSQNSAEKDFMAALSSSQKIPHRVIQVIG